MQGSLGLRTLVVAELLKLAARQSRWLRVCSSLVGHVPDGRQQQYGRLAD